MGTDVENPSLSQPILTSNNPSLPPQISISKPHPPPPIHRELSLSLSLSTDSPKTLCLSLPEICLPNP
ncbi:hypothetical protein Scep_029429 [Stephania cephalantha]|uniref:Uncharacterized protein n=1 Tax=Stephania cephalantha TaxID=152367 RepID=A0AAP0E5D0_9MAGN